MRNILALIGSLLSIISIIPYLADILKRRTKPNIVSWFTWTLLTGIAAVATFAVGEPRSAILMVASTVCSLLVVLFGLKFGIAKFSLFDGVCWLGAMLGVALWAITDSPTVAIVTTVVIDFVGVLPTVRHSWKEPGEETWQTFVICTVAALFTVLSLSPITFAGILYPIYLVLANGLIAGVVVYRRKQEGISLKRHSVHETLHE